MTGRKKLGHNDEDIYLVNKTSTLLSQTVKLMDRTDELEDRNEELLEERVNFRTCKIGQMNLCN